MGLDLLSTFVLTRYIFVVFLQKKIRTLLLKTSSRGRVRTPTLPVALGLCKMILLALHSEPELETVWRALVYHRSCFITYYRLYRVSASSEVCTVTVPSIE